MVARRLQSEYPIAGLQTLAELADRAGVSGPTVIRCIRKLGYDSYPEFQDVLHEEIQARFDGELAVDGRTERNQANSLEDSYASSLLQTIRSVQHSDLNRLSYLLARNRSNVLCLGGRVSQALAMIFQAHLLRMRRNVELVSNDPVQRAERLMDISKGDIVVVFDYQPYDMQTVSFSRLATGNKATLVCFTDSGPSPAANNAQFVIDAELATSSGISLSAAVCAVELVLASVRDKVGIRATARQRSIARGPGFDPTIPVPDPG